MASTASFSDNFDAASLSASWDKNLAGDGSQITQFGGQLQITHTANSQYNTLETVSTYDLTGSSFFVQILNFGNYNLSSHETQLQAYLDSVNKIWLVASGNSLQLYKLVANVQTQIGSISPLDLREHKWFRLRESGGTIFADTSYDGINWTNRFSLANPFVITAIKMLLVSGCYSNEASATGSSFDNFNVVQSAPSGISGIYRMQGFQ